MVANIVYISVTFYEIYKKKFCGNVILEAIIQIHKQTFKPKTSY